SSQQIQPGAGRRVQPAADDTVHVLIVDGVGRRTGFDPSTGRSLSEIPGVQYLGVADGIDTYDLPGRLGGYTVGLSSSVARQVTLEANVGGEPVHYPVQVGPGGPTWVAAVAAMTTSGQPALNVLAAQPPGPASATSCSPRPPVRVQASGDGARR